MEILNVILIVVEVLVLFNLLIIVHELGHFLAARWRGLVVDRFGVWFGKPIWQKKIGEVTYCLGFIPAGGFVSLPQMAPMEAIEGQVQTEGQDYPPVKPWDKIIVAFAGPLFSFLLALTFALIIWVIGRPVSEVDTTTVIGYVTKDSPAEKIGLKAGDRILSVDGHPVNRFSGIGDSIKWRIISSEGETIAISVDRMGKTLDFMVPPRKEETRAWERKSLREIMVSPYQTAIVGKVIDHSPAAAVGLKPNDIIQKANGEALYSPRALVDIIEQVGLNPVALEVKRGDKVFNVSVRPEVPVQPPDEKKPRLGIEWDLSGHLTLDHPGPLEQIQTSVNSMISTFAVLFSSKSDVKAQHLSGPVGILRIYYLLFQSEHGWRMAIWFSVIFNVNLALLNLLPIPVLDGGHIVLATLEALWRKTVSVRILNHVQTACAMIIISYMLYITFFDVQDLPWKREKQRSTRLEFSPKPAPNVNP